jgi:hypothetical protein
MSAAAAAVSTDGHTSNSSRQSNVSETPCAQSSDSCDHGMISITGAVWFPCAASSAVHCTQRVALKRGRKKKKKGVTFVSHGGTHGEGAQADRRVLVANMFYQ